MRGCPVLSHSSEANPDPVLLDIQSQSSSASRITPQFRVVVFSSVLWFPFSELGWIALPALQSQSGKEAPRGLNSMLTDQLLFRSSLQWGDKSRHESGFSTIRPVTAAIQGRWPFPMFSTVRSEMPKSPETIWKKKKKKQHKDLELQTIYLILNYSLMFCWIPLQPGNMKMKGNLGWFCYHWIYCWSQQTYVWPLA